MASLTLKTHVASLVVAVAAALSAPMARAHDPSGEASAASALSLSVPVAVSVAAPSTVLVGGAVLTVVAAQASAVGTVWVLERASDGARMSLQFSARAAEGASVAAGTVVLVTAVSAGYVLSVAGEAIAFIPNELGRALLHNERITR